MLTRHKKTAVSAKLVDFIHQRGQLHRYVSINTVGYNASVIIAGNAIAFLTIIHSFYPTAKLACNFLLSTPST